MKISTPLDQALQTKHPKMRNKEKKARVQCYSIWQQTSKKWSPRSSSNKRNLLHLPNNHGSTEAYVCDISQNVCVGKISY